MPASLAAIIGTIVWFVIMYFVIRNAVTNGILKADQSRQR